MSFTVTDEHIERYATDGVVCLRQAIPIEWIESLRRGIEKNLESPTERSRLWDRADDGSTTFYDSQAWQTVDEYQDFVLNSPMAELAARVMGVSLVNFFFDAIFVRSQGAQFKTPFHQDEPYWSVSGFDCSSSWMPLVPVEYGSALELVRGSHLWEQSFAKDNFGALGGDPRDQIAYDSIDGLVPFPDIESDRSSYDLVTWAMEPGDVVIFNARTVHGGGGNLGADRDLRVFNTKWLGDDARVCFRPEGMDPDHSDVMTEAGLRPGDRVGGPMYPQVWPTTVGQ